MTIENIKDAILSLFNFSIIEENEERILFKVISDNIAYLEKNQINSIINQLSNFSSDQDVELFNSNSYEVLVTDVSRLILPKEIEQKDLVNNIEYKIDKPTNNYLIFFCQN